MKQEEVQLLTNALGDVYARVVGGQEEPINPDAWGWLPGKAAERRSVPELQGLPGFAVTVIARPDLYFVPGPKPPRPKSLLKWPNGAAPAAVALSKAGALDGTSGRYGRLSDALGYAAFSLPRNPQSNPFHVYDLVSGRLIVISYVPPEATPGGRGTVYVIEDGLGIKIGHTNGPVAKRVAELQTGNPRLITIMVAVYDASDSVEAYLHDKFSEWNIQGEWFDRSHLLAQARAEGGWGNLVRYNLPEGEDWRIEIFPPYG